MDQRTQAYLMCIGPSRKIGHEEEQEGEQKSEICGGELIQRDELTLLCMCCGTEYPIKSGIPQFLPKAAYKSSYLDDDVIQMYYEMHFGSRISGPSTTARLSFPQLDLVGSSGKDTRVERFTAVRLQREGLSEELRIFYQSLAHLIGNPHLTEDFYQYMLDLCRPLLNTDSVVLDIGCALGRMSDEIAALGVTYVIGLDRSPRMTEEAMRLVGTPGPIPIKLNLVGGKTIGAHLTLNYQLDNVDFIAGDAEHLPFRAGAFDLALGLNLLDRVSDPHRAIAEMARILKSGGHLIVTDPYHWEDSPAEQKHWVNDMSVLFDPGLWECEKEVDGIPFVMRGSSRRLRIYLNHCLIYRKR